ncbi:FGGY-family carbohydrate kinase [Apibacter sp. HY039]|uniref:xylulokinase n=1 Tax=Apibacter sp. HY039 TaxID=2501476 RepID=UPI000FEBA1F7|nr:FGGY-family carbohydrate kinase [Apibacter sp. HY039]
MNAKKANDGPLVIAIDSSTTSTKAIIVDVNGKVWETAKRNIQLHTPAMDFYEHNPLRWWETTKECVGEVLSKLSAKDRERVSAIGITHQRESFAPFDEQGKPLRNGILWLDGRATKQIRKYGSPHVHDLSGKPPGVTPGIYKMAWIKENEPEIFEKAYKVVEVHGYIAWNLTGRWVSSVAATDSLGLLDIRNFDYSSELLNIAGVKREQMADLVSPADVMDMLKPELVAEWKLPKPIPVIAGLGDGQAAGIGAAAVSPDVAFLNLGTAVNAGVESPIYKCDPVFRTHVSGIKDNYVFEILQSSGSYLAGWFRQSLGDPKLLGEPDPLLDEEASKIPPGCEGLVTLPYWNAVQSPYWDSVARGAVVGWRGTHSRAHMYRSILESIGFEMKFNLESIQKGTGVPLKSIRAMGGGTRSKLWRQIMADTIGLPITVCLEDEISALGASVLAMAGIQAHGSKDVAHSAKEMASFGDTVEPDLSQTERYNEVADIQRQLYPQLKNVFEQLYNLSEKYPSTKPESPKAEL